MSSGSSENRFSIDVLREQMMINKFIIVTGCPSEKARKLLQLNNWQFETALSIFFQEPSVQQYHQNSRFNPMCTPANTPATPPSFPDVLLAFSKLSTSAENKNDNNNLVMNSSAHHSPAAVSTCTPITHMYQHRPFTSPSYDNLSNY